MKVKDALTRLWKESGFAEDGGINDRLDTFEFFGVRIKFPNLSARGKLMHDINHLLSGYGTSWQQECLVTAWELGSGGRKGFGISWFYTLFGCAFGFLFDFKSAREAYRRGKSHVNAHILSHTHDVMEMELAALMQLSRGVDGAAHRPA